MSTVYFATNRNPDNKDNPTNFGPDFATKDLGDLRFGQVQIKNGKIDTSTLQVLPDDPKLGSEVVFKDLRETMKNNSDDSLIFIHGFNVSFEEALQTAAQITEKYFKLSKKSYRTNIFVFSWPSDGKASNYGNDRHDAEASGYAFARGLIKLANFLKGATQEEACQQKINLIAHSMGNYVLRHALQQAIKINGGQSLPRIFENVILAAADEDSDAFEHDYKLAKLSEMAQRITVYFNTGDLALVISDATKGNPDRLGHDGPSKPHQIPSKVVIVDASDIVHGISEHSYYVEADGVAKDIISVLQGESSEKIKSRDYVPHANKFKLTQGAKTK